MAYTLVYVIFFSYLCALKSRNIQHTIQTTVEVLKNCELTVSILPLIC